jgi:microcin C transport system permease protein
MSPRVLGWLLLLYAICSAGAWGLGLSLPFLKLPFFSFPELGWVLLAAMAALALWLLLRSQRDWHLSPLTLKQIQRFKKLKRGYYSMLIILGLLGLAMLDHALVGKRALIVRYQGQWFFPFAYSNILPGKTFGQNTEAETNYRELKQQFQKQAKGDWLLMPLVPFDSKLDSHEVIETLETRDGAVYLPGSKQSFSGRAYTSFPDKPEQKRQEFTFRHGHKQGAMTGWDLQGQLVEKAIYLEDKQQSHQDLSADQRAAQLPTGGQLRTQIYPPAPPSWQHQHYLGTNSTGNDVLAMLFGGLQQSFAAALLYLTFVFTIGIILGASMGYFGGWWDLLGQRFIEIWSALPFLFVVMIISTLITPTLMVLVTLAASFGWIGTASLLRTATYREKTRDYVAAAQLLGAGTGRMLFKHVLPNTLAILVTLAPFEVAGVISTLAALDFLGFGLPPELPSWGRLLHEGTEGFEYPWIVSSASTAMVITLILVTFVGEAVREAFDPKKFTFYR